MSEAIGEAVFAKRSQQVVLFSRCRMDGGPSTGPRIAEGLARSRRSRWEHGLYSAEAREEQKRMRELLNQSRELLKQMLGG